MSKLNDLINKLCPDGVEWKKIGNIADITRGVVMSKDYINEHPGEYPVYSSQTVNNGEIGKIDTYNFEGEYLTWTTDGAYAGAVFYRNGKFSVTNVCGLINIKDKEHISTKYIKYILSINTQSHVTRGMGNAKLMSNVMASIEIPVPPLEIQNEIVRILDNFTELEEELEEELEARRKQYEYYRDSLLTFDDSVDYKSIGELFDFKNGLNKGKEAFGSGIPFIKYTDVYKNRKITKSLLTGKVELSETELKAFAVKKGDVMFTRCSETKEEVGMVSAVTEDLGDCAFNGFVLRARPKTDLLLPDYCSYCFGTYNVRKEIIRTCSFTTRANTTGVILSKIKIPVPSLEKQQKIVDVLDRFESLCNDITSGLPAEIETRHKQYEYYRDKLLTFKRKGEMSV